jgi:hypothetical protein
VGSFLSTVIGNIYTEHFEKLTLDSIIQTTAVALLLS